MSPRLIAVMMCCLCLSGCSAEDRDWKAVSQQPSIKALEAFITQHPNGAHVGEAKALIVSLGVNTAIPFNVTCTYRFALPPGGLTSSVADGPMDNALLIFDPPIPAPGSIESLTVGGAPIELADGTIRDGRVKTRAFGDLKVMLRRYRLDDGQTDMVFYTTLDMINQMKIALKLQDTKK